MLRRASSSDGPVHSRGARPRACASSSYNYLKSQNLFMSPTVDRIPPLRLVTTLLRLILSNFRLSFQISACVLTCPYVSSMLLGGLGRWSPSDGPGREQSASGVTMANLLQRVPATIFYGASVAAIVT